MSFEPEAVRAFEHAGWQRAAARYKDTFAQATAPFIAPLLEAAGVSADSACSTSHADPAMSRRLPLRAARPRKDWTSRPRWSALHGTRIPASR